MFYAESDAGEPIDADANAWDLWAALRSSVWTLR